MLSYGHHLHGVSFSILSFLNFFVSLDIKWASWWQHVVGLSVFIQPVNLCLLIGEFNQFTFKVITHKEGPTSVIALFIFYMPYSFLSLTFFFMVLLFFLILFIYLFIYLFMAVLGLHFCARAFSSCGKWGPLFIAVRRPLTIAVSLVAEHRL